MSKIKWYELNENTLKLAKNENKAIFIFIGYETSYLFEKMKNEVLKNKVVVELLNKNFIPIKIDKDERQDVDKYYQEVHKLLNKETGGWPLSIFLTPQNKPFFAGTYIPLESDKKNVEGMGFLELLKIISNKVNNNDPSLQKNADEIEEFLGQIKHPTQATVLKESFIQNFLSQARNNYDTRNKGFASTPKFLHVNVLSTLLYISKNFNDNSAKAMLKDTLTAMQNSDILDKKNGGFYRYSNSDDFSNPNDEKSIYDNTILTEIFYESASFFDEESFKKTALLCLNSLNETKKYDENALLASTLFKLNETKKAQKIVLNLVKEFEKQNRFFNDYAFFIQSLILCYKNTYDSTYLIKAHKLINDSLTKFYKQGLFMFSDTKFTTKAEVKDNIHISAVSVMISNMLEISTILNDEKYKHFAFKTMEYNSYEIGRETIYYPSMLKQILIYLKENKS